MLGSGLDTEFMFGVGSDEQIIEPVNAAMYNHWIGTMPWCWVLAGLTGLALHVAGRAGAVRAGSAGSAWCSAASPCCSASRRCSTWPA